MASEIQFVDNLFALEKLADAQRMDPGNKDKIRSWAETLGKYNKRLEEKLQQAAGKNILPVDLTGREDQEQVRETVQEMQAYAEEKQACRKNDGLDPEAAVMQDKPTLSEIIFFVARRLEVTLQILKSLDHQTF